MLILSQDKNSILNTDKCSEIYRAGTYIRIIYPYVSNYVACIGEYKSNERAQEVFKELLEKYSNWENLKAGQPTGICNPIYEMPQE